MEADHPPGSVGEGRGVVAGAPAVAGGAVCGTKRAEGGGGGLGVGGMAATDGEGRIAITATVRLAGSLEGGASANPGGSHEVMTEAGGGGRRVRFEAPDCGGEPRGQLVDR